MSRGIEIKFKSAEAVSLATRQIDRYTKGVQERIRGVIRKGAVAIYDAAVRMAPSGPTGNLKKGFLSGPIMTGKARKSCPMRPIPIWLSLVPKPV